MMTLCLLFAVFRVWKPYWRVEVSVPESQTQLVSVEPMK